MPVTKTKKSATQPTKSSVKAKPAPAAKPAKKAGGPKAPTRAGVNPLVDEGLKIRWNEAIARYRKSRAVEMKEWDERYEALGEILDSDPPYYLAGGYPSALAFLAAEAPDQDPRTVRTYVRVARYFDPDDEAKHGISKLDALLDYLEAVGGAPLAPAKINLSKQKVRSGSGKAQKLVPFGEITVAELRASMRTARTPASKSAAKEPKAVKVVREALKKAGAGAVAVRMRNGKLDIGGIELTKLGAVAKALLGTKLDPA